jgi:hypothetical protein
MPLTGTTLPSSVPPSQYATSFDRTMAFAENQTRIATGFLDNINAQIDIGAAAALPSGAGIGSGVGRMDGFWTTQVSVMDFSNGDEFYRLFLLGSNDVAFGNGNVDLLAMHDFAAASAGRIVTPLMGASLAAPTRIYVPFNNLRQGLLYRYLRCQVVIGGTTPSITLTTWLSKARELF